jgi:hypothetical protein
MFKLQADVLVKSNSCLGMQNCTTITQLRHKLKGHAGSPLPQVIL